MILLNGERFYTMNSKLNLKYRLNNTTHFMVITFTQIISHCFLLKRNKVKS